MDEKTTIAELKKKALAFRDERGWARFHKPRNMAISIVLEAAELLEHFQWLSEEEIADHLHGCGRGEIADEMSDILVYLLTMAADLDIDLSSSVESKMKKNAAKYPKEISDGNG